MGEGEGGRRNASRGHIQRIVGALSGPRKLDDGSVLPTSERKLNMRWQPPRDINLKELAGELLATIRMVDSDKEAIPALMALI